MDMLTLIPFNSPLVSAHTFVWNPLPSGAGITGFIVLGIGFRLQGFRLCRVQGLGVGTEGKGFGLAI